MQPPVAKLVKNPPANIQSLDREDLLEEEIATHSSILPWKIPCSMDWHATVHEVAKSQRGLKSERTKHARAHVHTHTYKVSRIMSLGSKMSLF